MKPNRRFSELNQELKHLSSEKKKKRKAPEKIDKDLENKLCNRKVINSKSKRSERNLRSLTVI